MKPQFDQILYTSFRLWAEDFLLSKGESYIQNIPNQFKKVAANNVSSNYNVFQGKFKQLVSDTTLGNSGIYINGQLNTGQSGIKIDFLDGRIIIPTGLGTNLNITGLSTIREFNLYDYYDAPEKLFLHSDFYEKNSGIYLWEKDNRLDENSYFIPALFINQTSSKNSPYSMSGEDTTESNIEIVVVGKNSVQLDACLSLFRDAKLKTFPIFDFGEQPYGQYWTNKNGQYSYNSLKNQYPNNKHALLADVQTTKLTENLDKANKLKYPTGFIKIKINTIRFPRL